MKTKISASLVFIIALHSCSIAQKENSVHIYIPMNYTGWVNLIFNDSSSSIEPLKFENGYVYLITKDPQVFRLKGGDFPSGKYDMHYYYYNTDTTIELCWAGYPKQNIFFEGRIGSKSKNGYRASLYAFSFYVSRQPLDVDGLSRDNLPMNKILTENY
jgi:hypothetical protein